MKRTLLLGGVTLMIIALLYFKRDRSFDRSAPSEKVESFDDAVGLWNHAPTLPCDEDLSTKATEKQKRQHSPDPVPPPTRNSL